MRVSCAYGPKAAFWRQMLIQFSVQNHRSLRDEHSLSLTAAAFGSEDERLIRTPALSDRVLPAVALYGANASGKTNVLHALAFMRHAVLQSYRLWEPDGGVPVEPFALSSVRSSPSEYEVDLIVDGMRQRYGFVCGSERIEEEWLFAWPSGHQQTWFEREGDEYHFGRNFPGDNEAIRKLTRPNSLFLAAAAQNNHARLLPLFRWFRTTQIDLRRPRPLGLTNTWMLLTESPLSLFGSDDPISTGRGAILELLRWADTGIIDVRVEESERDSGTPGRSSRRRTRILFRHKAAEDGVDGTWLPLEVESAGTAVLIELAPRLNRVLETGGLICIDELEASLHPMLALALLGLFQDPLRNKAGAQLIFTTHDTNLLGNTLGEAPLRRDQIWFTEKDEAGATRLYPLTDFHPRKNENLERGYLQGRYGAIPFLGDLPAGADENGDL